MDTTFEFLTAFFTQKFSSFEEFHSQLRDFERETGCIYIIQSSKLLPHNHIDRGRLIYSELNYQCYHHGVCHSDTVSRRNPRASRGSCGSRISLPARCGKLWITKYYMTHNHQQLPENTIIDQNIRRLQVQEYGRDDIIISDDVQKVLDDIVIHAPITSITYDSDSPTKSSRPMQERKAAAKDRLAARTKKARGLKLAPHLRRLAELAASGTGSEFMKHIAELEVLAEIWRRGGVSPLAAGFTTASTDSSSVTPSPNDTMAIAKAVENLFRKQRSLDGSSTTVRSPGGPPKGTQIITPIASGGGTVSVIQSSQQPMVLKQALGSQSGVVTISSDSVANYPKDVMITDAPSSGQFQLINGASIFTAAGQKGDNGADGQPIVGYVIQPTIFSSGANNSGNYVPIAPKLPITDVTMQNTFQAIPPPPPKVLRPPLPVNKPKNTKPRGRQPKCKSSLAEAMLHDGPMVARFEDRSIPKPWTPMIVEGDACSYFLFVEDVNYCYSPEEEAWVPYDQRTMAVDG